MRSTGASRFQWIALAAATLVAAGATVSTSTAAPLAAPKACALLSRSIASSLIKEQPKTILSTPLICQYGRSSERASTAKTTLSFTITPNPSVAAAQAAMRRVARIAPTKAPAGTTGFARASLAFHGGEGIYVYFRQAHGPLTGGYVFLRIGAYLAQLTPAVYSSRPSFTAAELKKAALAMAARWS
ncbi:MAG TPA: hypothetical protein VFA66_01265 [Gaiellaceae bacterium]|nr:hypothetical protein [Gaiellaceae bacterium]